MSCTARLSASAENEGCHEASAPRTALATGCDAGIRYHERLEQDLIGISIGPHEQRFAAAAATAYLQQHGRPKHPRELLDHACLRGQSASAAKPAWEFERKGERVEIEPIGPLLVRIGAAADLAVDAAVASVGVIYLFEDWLTARCARR